MEILKLMRSQKIDFKNQKIFLEHLNFTLNFSY